MQGKDLMTIVEPHQPPESPEPSEKDTEALTQNKDIIHPIDYSPDDAYQRRWQWRISPIKLLLGVALLFILCTAAFVFSARSLVVDTTPVYATVEIQGGMAVPLGSRYLLLGGDYLINIKAPGYFALTEPLTIDKKQNQRFSAILNKTPGLLDITTDPISDVQVLVDQREVGISPLSSLELAAGEHEIAFRSARFLPLQQTIQIDGKGKQQALSVTLKPAWAEVGLNSLPEQAQVIIDGEAIGNTPIQTQVLKGQHTVAIALKGYQAWSGEFTVIAGVNQDIDLIELKPIAAWLQLRTQPSAANVTFNGDFKGQTPLRITMAPDQNHQLAVFKAGYEMQRRQINQVSSEEKSLTLTLKPKLGTVNINIKPSDAAVYVDSKAVGTGPQVLQLPSYQQVVEVRRAGYKTHRMSVTPRPGFEQSIAIKLLTEHQAKWASVKSKLTTAAGQALLLLHPKQFTMGASRREAGRRSNETLRTVQMKRPFYLSNKEVTNAQFREFKNDHSSGHVEGQTLDSDLQPVVKVTWEQAAAYCNWLSEQDNLKPFYQFEKQQVVAVEHKSKGYRLPTEAEWAWAARTQNTLPPLKYPWGKNLPPTAQSGNYADEASAAITGRAIANYQDGFVVTAPVGSYAANRLSLFDMGGNVAEWTNDYYGLNSPQGGTVPVDPVGPSEGEYRVIRGSSWAHGTITELRLSYRDYGKDGRNDVGFRLARYVE
jgi:formylglycine-generating enzyme required for sulfatase activity